MCDEFNTLSVLLSDARAYEFSVLKKIWGAYQGTMGYKGDKWRNNYILFANGVYTFQRLRNPILQDLRGKSRLLIVYKFPKWLTNNIALRIMIKLSNR